MANTRPAELNSETAEVRFECAKWVMNVLDAVWMARLHGRSRTVVINEILSEWAEQKRHEASLIHKLTDDKPS